MKTQSAGFPLLIGLGLLTAGLIVACSKQLPVSVDESSAVLTRRETEEMLRGMMQGMNVVKPATERIRGGRVPLRDLNVIAAVLFATPEYAVHNLRGANNTVFVSPDGHSEAVYNEAGTLVQDGINDGSYNYFTRARRPLQHFTFDTHPWVRFGNSDTDPTSVRERIEAWIKDLEIGIGYALEAKDKIDFTGQPDRNEPGQVEALAVFVRATEMARSDRFLRLFDEDAVVTDEKIRLAIADLEKGLKAVYGADR